MLITHQHPHNKSIMVGVLGLPNVGKSSLLNCLLGFDLSAVTHKPQTTRNHFQCAVTIDRTEIILVDTPGLHKSSKELNIRMNGQANEGTWGCDIHLLLIDLSVPLKNQFTSFKEMYVKDPKETWVVFTKSDLIPDVENMDMAPIVEEIKGFLPQVTKHFVISSKTEEGVHLLTGELCDKAEPGPHLYPDERISNRPERFFVTEYIREQAFEQLHEELPYELAVVIDEFKDVKAEKEGERKRCSISASILVNRPSQRAIVVGSKGSVIKQIGIKAREKIEAMTGTPVFLNLHVKVSPRWFKNNFVLEELGLPRVEGSHRVWRKK